MKPLARIAAIILVLAASLGLSACSAIKLGYSTLPEVAFWWLDGYVDFQEEQEPDARRELARLHDWHRREELPKLVEILARMEDWNPDLIVLGTHGRGGFERFLLGSVAADVIGCAHAASERLDATVNPYVATLRDAVKRSSPQDQTLLDDVLGVGAHEAVDHLAVTCLGESAPSRRAHR